MKEQEYFETRIENQILWYSNKACKNKFFNNFFKIAIITSSSLIPFIASLEICETNKNAFLGFLGSIIAILSGVSGVLKFQEKWIEYRSTAESLKHEKFLFQAGIGPYVDKDKSFETLVLRVETLVSNENSNWNQYINKQN
jgi:hypothetical protein